jgi:SAM-dependent methyltransferase
VSEGEWGPDAENWVRWARTPGHDAYWFYRDAFFDRLLPPAGRRTLEIGCGEGRVARDLAARGHWVAGVDTSHALLRHARMEDEVSGFALADSAALPFPDGCFDLAVAYNALQVVRDMSATVREAARVLDADGRLAICVSHPVTDLGRFASDDRAAPFTLRPRYFENERVEDTVERDGLAMTFRGWTYSLEDYAVALQDAGLRIEAMREPRPSGSDRLYERRQHVPMFLLILAGK